MKATKLIVSGPGGTSQISLDPQGTTLGRDSNCDVVLEDDSVSRVHARISQDPFGRWIIEDLDSHNGVFVEGQRIKAHVLLPSQKISMSQFILSLSEESERWTATGSLLRRSIPIIDRGPKEDIVSYRADQDTIISPALMQHLNELTGRLLKLSSPSELYSEACLCLAQILDTLVAIVRLPCGSEPLPGSPEILACHFGGDVRNAAILQTSYLHFSKRVLNAIRSMDVPVMASSKPSANQDLTLTVVDEDKPHVVFSARVNDLGDSVDALYVDVLQERSPKEMFDFVEVAARQINFAQKNLFLEALKMREQALSEANIQLKEKDRIKDEYVSRVTHDIKGHLTAIQSCLHITGDQSLGPLNEKQSDFLGRARRRTTQLSDFVNELLDLTQMRLSGEFKTAAFSLPESISRALSTVQRKAEDKSITLTSNVEPSVGDIIGNEFSINEVLTNLLFNAIKYTPENKTVHIEAKSSDDYVQIDIVDTGIGIPSNELGNIFDEFFRASNAKKSGKEGTGLGLSIVKQIVERHGGGISAKSQEGKGTTFSVTLPKGGSP
ncbi:MAG: ATP-binding protein [Planctomycetota bacterium]|jgi:signal transduction histidine kinase